MGAEGLKSNDSRRWQQSPHLRISIDYLHQIFDHLANRSIRMYRMSSDIAPYVTHPEMPQFHRQVRECAAELRALGRRARGQDLRLSFHPSQFIVLNSPDRRWWKKASPISQRRRRCSTAWKWGRRQWWSCMPDGLMAT